MCVKFTHRKTGLPALICFSEKVGSAISDVVVNGLHALLGQWAGVLDLLCAVGIAPRSGLRHVGQNSFGS